MNFHNKHRNLLYMADFIEEKERIQMIDLDNLPDSLIYKLDEVDFTYSAAAFGVDEHLNIEYYEQRFEKAFPGLLKQFPMLYYMVEEWRDNAIKLTPLEHIEARKSYFFEKNDDNIMCLTEEEILLDGRQLRNNKNKDI